MPLFDREETEFGTDVATGVLSRTPVESDFVERVYENLSSVYDLTFGPLLHPGRLFAKDRMGIKPGDRLLDAVLQLRAEGGAAAREWSCDADLDLGVGGAGQRRGETERQTERGDPFHSKLSL